jgi:hypothetical protein
MEENLVEAARDDQTATYLIQTLQHMSRCLRTRFHPPADLRAAGTFFFNHPPCYQQAAR